MSSIHSSGCPRAISIVLGEPGTETCQALLPGHRVGTGGPQRGGVLTPGKGPGQQGDVVAPAPHPGLQVVPELVVGGEVNDSGWHSHDPVRRRRGVRGTCPPWALAGSLGPMSMCLGRWQKPESPNSQGGGQAAPQRPDALMACDLHKGVLGREQSTRDRSYRQETDKQPPRKHPDTPLGWGDPCPWLKLLPVCQ